jgi:NitT/TauT family transport system ATP-binding protein
MTASLQVRELGKTFPAATASGRVAVLRSVSFVVHSGEWFSVVGPSGCGKSTLVNIIAGFVKADVGRVLIAGRPVAGPGPDRVVVFQDSALFEWKTVRENVEFGLKAQRVPARERTRRALDHLRRVHLNGAEDLYPYALSGGMKQRLAMARALAVDPACLLLDEPLAGIDAQLRVELQDELQAIWAATGKTVLLVTHDIEEAVYLSDHVMILTPPPTTVAAVIAVDLPRPRTFTLRSQPSFLAVKEQVWTALRSGKRN